MQHGQSRSVELAQRVEQMAPRLGFIRVYAWPFCAVRRTTMTGAHGCAEHVGANLESA